MGGTTGGATGGAMGGAMGGAVGGAMGGAMGAISGARGGARGGVMGHEIIGGGVNIVCIVVCTSMLQKLCTLRPAETGPRSVASCSSCADFIACC